MNINGGQNDLMRSEPRQATQGSQNPSNFISKQFLHLPGHKISNSDEKQRLQSKQQLELDVFADPTDLKSKDRKPRRNSESSVRDKRNMDPEEEKRRRERKLRETKRTASKSGKPNKKLDVIDKLDVTSIYGTGCKFDCSSYHPIHYADCLLVFHHDGPFDACNPQRNRKREKYAPMQAFPKDSVNMVMGGSGPVNKTMDYDKFHGFGQEAHIDFNEAAVVDERPEALITRQEPSATFNPTTRHAIHGDETVGLGTSTFLEGAPASRAAIQRRESEFETQQFDEPRTGLSRKKSLAQKIRGVRPTRDRVTTPEGRIGGAISPPLTGRSDSAVNPFFRNYDQDGRKDATQQITFAEDQPRPMGRVRAPSSPKRNELERRITTESIGEEGVSKPTGLLGRMKSLKGRRPQRRDTNS